MPEKRIVGTVWRIFKRHRYPIAGIVSLFAALFTLGIFGCAGAKITPAVNKVDAVQTSSGPSERTVITIGGVEQPLPKGAK